MRGGISTARDDYERLRAEYGSHTVPAGAFRHVLGTDPNISEYRRFVPL